MAQREQENILHNVQPCSAVQQHWASQACSLGAFSFQPPRVRIDWRMLHGVDVDQLVRCTDIDALEGVLDVVAYGDIEAEDTRNLTPLNFIKLFRIAQLTVEYLLFVQDRLAADNCALKGEAGRLGAHVDVLQLKLKEQREELAAGRKELKSIKRAMRTLEALALAQRQQPAPPALQQQQQQQPEVQVVERVVEAADPVVQYKLERMEAEVRELTQEREAVNREVLRLKDALAAAQADRARVREASIAAAVEAARREEREAAEERIQAALEEQHMAHLRDSKTKVSVVADSEESCFLRAKLAGSLRRQRELEKQNDLLELELVHALGSPKRAASPTTTVRHLRAELEAAQAEILELQGKLHSEQPHSRGVPARSSGNRLQASGVGSMLEDASEASEARLEQLQAQVDDLNAELSTALAPKAKLQRADEQLKDELQDTRQQLSRLQKQGPGEPSWVASEMERLDEEVAKVQEANKELQRENASLRRAAASKAGAASGRHHCSPAQQGMSPAGSRSPPRLIRAQHVTSQPETARVTEAEASETAGLGSPIEALAATESTADRPPSPCSSPARQQPSPRQHPTVTVLGREDRSQYASRSGSPTGRARRQGPASWQQLFEEEMQHSLEGHERPGVVSRFPHSLGDMLKMRRELMGELNAEVEREMATYGVSPRAQRMTDAQFRAAMVELAARREEAAAAMSAQDRQRMQYMRQTITGHVEQVARSMAGSQPEGCIEARADELLSPRRALKPIRTRTEEPAARAVLRPNAVELATEGDPATAAFYSPLRSGASQLSFRSDSQPSSPGGSPHSVQASGPMVEDEDGTPRSPWNITHDRVFHSRDVGSAESPLARGVRRGQLPHPGGRSLSPGLRSPLPKSPMGPYGGGAARRRAAAGGGGASPAAAQVQRLPRRVARSTAGGGGGGEGGITEAASPRSLGSPSRRHTQMHGSLQSAAHRYPPDLDDGDSPLASPGAQQTGSGPLQRSSSTQGLVSEDAEDVAPRSLAWTSGSRAGAGTLHGSPHKYR